MAAYLDHLEQAGFDGSPRFLGRDAVGRDVLTFIEGSVPGAVVEPWVLSERLLASVGRLVRRLHEASSDYDPAAEPFPPRPVRQDDFELVTHLDVTPQNTVVRGGEAVALIDFDLAGPSTRLIDSYNTAMHWVPLRDPFDVGGEWLGADQLRRLRIFADAYGWSAGERRRLAGFGAERADLSWLRMKHYAEAVGGGWARMWRDGAGDQIRRRRDWLLGNQSGIAAALLG